MRETPIERRTLFSDKKKKVSHIVWHAATGCWVDSDKVIHHIDENTYNNELGNLQLMTRSDHAILHNIDRTYSEDAKKKMSIAWTPERKLKHSKRMSGKNNPNYGNRSAT